MPPTPRKQSPKRKRAPGAGRKPRADAPTDRSIRVGVTEAEMADIDTRRQALPKPVSRAEFIRRCVFGPPPASEK
jgi:hypothetical protein